MTSGYKNGKIRVVDKTREYRHSKQSPYHISTGGVVYEKRGGRIFVVLLGKKTAKGKVRYHLPKGTLRFNETLEHGAKREDRC